nr:tudor domain-containing protein 3-like [Malus domestica]
MHLTFSPPQNQTTRETGTKNREGSSGGAVESLRTRGWCFGDLEQVEEKILIQPALSDNTRTVVNSVEAKLINMNLKSISARSMPDPHTLLRSSHLLGPKVLQGRCQKQNGGFFEEFESSVAFDALRSLTTATAVEYSHPSVIPDDVVPGTKVCLEGEVTVRNGIVCLSPKIVTLLGGVVQSLYEEWQMNTKYSEFSRSSLRISQESEGNGPLHLRS